VRKSHRRSLLLLLNAAAAAIGLVCGVAYAAPPLQIGSVQHQAGDYVPGRDYRVDGYRPKPVAPEDLPDYQDHITSIAHPGMPVDSQGVALWRFNGHLYYHPLLIVRYGIAMVHTYRISQKPPHLERAAVNADWLINNAVPRNGALYFPYRFNWPAFGNRHDLMRAPWFSAMVQGQALILFTRLYAMTGDAHWQKAADATFASLLRAHSRKRPWAVDITTYRHHRYLWLEEYAQDPPSHALNGHMYALFGVWEYAFATRSEAAARVFDGAATTIRHQVQRFRVPGGISYYSLRVHAQYPSYHCIHVWQLKLLTRMTGDPWFAKEGRRFGADGRHAHAGCKG